MTVAPTRNPVSCPSVRTDSVVGIVGTSSASAVRNTALARQRDARRAVEDRDVVVLGERLEQRRRGAGSSGSTSSR